MNNLMNTNRYNEPPDWVFRVILVTTVLGTIAAIIGFIYLAFN